jgi:hypothetical protein
MHILLKSVFFCFLILSLTACGNKSGNPEMKIPTTLLSKEQMTLILCDMHLLEAAVNLRTAQNQTASKKDTLIYSDIFKKQGTTYEIFQENFKYYASQPVLLSKIYDEVIIDLTRKEAEEEKKK